MTADATGLMAVMAGTYGTNTAITHSHGTVGSEGRDIWHQYSDPSQPMALRHTALWAKFFILRGSQHIDGCLGLRIRRYGPDVKQEGFGWRRIVLILSSYISSTTTLRNLFSSRIFITLLVFNCF